MERGCGAELQGIDLPPQPVRIAKVYSPLSALIPAPVRKTICWRTLITSQL
jgi:hypothetical protein